MFKSWKTAAAGIIAIVSYALPFFGVPIPPEVLQGVGGIVLGTGLLVAKDGNVTGGTVDNGKRPR